MSELLWCETAAYRRSYNIGMHRADYGPQRKTVNLLRSLSIAGVLLYPLALLWSLYSTVSVHWPHLGYGFHIPENPIYSLFTYALAVFPGLYLTGQRMRPSVVMAWIFFLLVYAPAQILPVFAAGQDMEISSLTQISLIIGFMIMFGVTLLPVRQIPRLAFPPSVFWFGLAIVSLASYGYLTNRFGFPTTLPGFSEVYDVRESFGNELGMEGGWIGRLMNLQSRVVNPLLIAYGVVNRRPLAIIIGLGGQFFLYSLAGHKSVVLSALLVVAIIFAHVRSGRFTALFFGLGSTLAIAAWSLMDLAFESVTFTTLFIRRLVMTPGILTGHFFEYFSSHSYTYVIGPFLKPFASNPYGIGAAHIIGREYFGDVGMSANANFWADGFASLGLSGVIVVSILVGMLMWLYDSLALNRSVILVGVLAALSAYSLTNSAFMVSLITHGILVSLVVLVVMPESKAERQAGMNGKPAHDRNRKLSTRKNCVRASKIRQAPY